MIRLALCFLERKAAEGRCQFHHITLRVHTINMTSVEVNFGHLAGLVFVRSLPCKVTLPPHAFDNILFERQSPCTAKEWEIMLPLL